MFINSGGGHFFIVLKTIIETIRIFQCLEASTILCSIFRNSAKFIQKHPFHSTNSFHFVMNFSKNDMIQLRRKDWKKCYFWSKRKWFDHCLFDLIHFWYLFFLFHSVSFLFIFDWNQSSKNQIEKQMNKNRINWNLIIVN